MPLHSMNRININWTLSSGQRVGAEASQAREARAGCSECSEDSRLGAEQLERLSCTLHLASITDFQQNIPDGLVSRGNSTV